MDIIYLWNYNRKLKYESDLFANTKEKIMIVCNKNIPSHFIC